MTSPIVVGVALREDDSAPIALGRDLARLTGAPLALVHAYPYEQPPPSPSSCTSRDARALARGARAARRAAAPRARGHRPGRHGVVARRRPARRRDRARRRPRRGRLHAPRAGRPRRARQRHRAAAARRAVRRRRGAARATPAAAPSAASASRFVDTPEGRDALAAAALFAGLCGGTVRAFTIHEPVPRGPRSPCPAGSTRRRWTSTAVERAIAAAERARELVPADVLEDVEVITGQPADALITVSSRARPARVRVARLRTRPRRHARRRLARARRRGRLPGARAAARGRARRSIGSRAASSRPWRAEPCASLVAGGGVAALETVLALRTLGGPRLSIELLAPEQRLHRSSELRRDGVRFRRRGPAPARGHRAPRARRPPPRRARRASTPTAAARSTDDGAAARATTRSSSPPAPARAPRSRRRRRSPGPPTSRRSNARRARGRRRRAAPRRSRCRPA